MDPKDQDQQKSLSKLEQQVEQWEEVQGTDDFWGKGDLEDSRAKLYILAASFHAHCPPASVTKLENCGENIAQQESNERHQGRRSQEGW